MVITNTQAFEAVDLSLAERRRGQAIVNISAEVASHKTSREAALLENKIRSLKLMMLELYQGLDSLTGVPAPTVELGIDFYDEVQRFEVELIKRALKLMGGHQINAARLLKLKPTTLNSKIKLYEIELEQRVFFK